MKDYGLVSIVVPVYRLEKFIEETMDCVVAQTYKNWELLLVDDCGGDDTVSIIETYCNEKKEPRIHLIHQNGNQGAAKARNLGVREAKGRYIAFLDGDDLWEPEKLEKELSFMEEKEAAFVFTGYEFAEEDGSRTGKIVHVPAQMEYKDALKNTTIFTTTVMFDLNRIDKKLIEMPDMKSEDTALWWKVLRNGYTAYGLNENLARYRRPAQSLSSNKVEAVRRIWNLYRKAEGMSIPASLYHFFFWGYNAVARRI